jgi:hypothetical protein
MTRVMNESIIDQVISWVAVAVLVELGTKADWRGLAIQIMIEASRL